ncbi:MAG TPA: DinB family protein [Phycisphaerae bacterium]|nr:DinB family protein [Phycisphaerae bacterium]
MAASDPTTILLTHDRWATRQILDACGKLTEEQFHRRFEMGPGSLHNTTTHILGAMRAWTQILLGQQPGVRLEAGGQRSVSELLALLEQCADEFAAEVRRLPLDQTVTRVRDGMTYTFTRGAVLTQVATHGMHHRAQCLNMLRQLGVSPLPVSSVVEWTWLGETAAG